jgi:pantothenate kinase
MPSPPRIKGWSRTFLGVLPHARVIGLAGSVAWQSDLAHPAGAARTLTGASQSRAGDTDSFLFRTASSLSQGLMERKGFRLRHQRARQLPRSEVSEPEVTAPVYSHVRTTSSITTRKWCAPTS